MGTLVRECDQLHARAYGICSAKNHIVHLSQVSGDLTKPSKHSSEFQQRLRRKLRGKSKVEITSPRIVLVGRANKAVFDSSRTSHHFCSP
jgi:hypothetical protein